MQRVDSMARRLPQLYRDGELLRGSRSAGGVLEVPAVQLEVLDEEMRRVQRTHWLDATFELEHAAALAAVLDFVPEPWQNLETFRAWVHAIRDAMLREGGVTVPAIRSFVSRYGAAFEAAEGIDTNPPLESWSSGSDGEGLRIEENPPLRRFARFPAAGALEPLQQFTIQNRGVDESPASFLMTGTTRGRESAPVIVNVTTGQAIAYLGVVPEGKRLWIRCSGEEVRASLEIDDVTANVRSVEGVVPGTPWTGAQVSKPAKPLQFRRGLNELWFFPLAFFDVLGLDRFLFSMPDLAMAQGRFDSGRFGKALFFQEPLMSLHVSWVERQPAAFTVHLPSKIVVSKRPLDEAMASRELLASSIGLGVDKLRGAGIRSRVELEPFAEEQRHRDTLRAVMPITFHEGGPVGAEGLIERGGSFEITGFDDSTFR
jgi:hypothetical protein